jgi:hypothetical protein
MRFFLALVSFLLALLLATPAGANAPAPPSLVWFHLADQVPVQGAQLVACETTVCDRPILLKQSGICRDAGCLPVTLQLAAAHKFDCAANTCLYVVSRLAEIPRYRTFKLIVQADRLLTTLPFELDFSIAFSAPQRFRVTANGQMLVVTPDHDARPSRSDWFWVGLALALVTELIVAALFLTGHKLAHRQIITMLVAIAFINLLTFPVGWLFFPAWQPWQMIATRVMGGFSLLVAIWYSVWLANSSTVTLKTLSWLFLTWLLTLPLPFVGIVALWFAYGQSAYMPAGLPEIITLPASELFAWGWETWLIARVGRSYLTLHQAALLSLLTNVASLILGLLLLPALQQMG